LVAAILFALTPVAAAIGGGTVCARSAGAQGDFSRFFPESGITPGMIGGFIAVILIVLISEAARLCFVAPRPKSSYAFAAIGLVLAIPIAFVVRYLALQVLVSIEAAIHSEQDWIYLVLWGRYILGIAAFGALAAGAWIGLRMSSKTRPALTA
jgi:hypothetical protein